MVDTLKFMSEKTDQERVFVFHFNKDINTFINRLATKVDVRQPNPMTGESTIVGYRYEPNKILTGIEDILPHSKFSLWVKFGKAFSYDTITKSLLFALEIDHTDKEWESWFTDIKDSYPDNIKGHVATNTVIKPESMKKSIDSKNFGFIRKT